MAYANTSRPFYRKNSSFGEKKLLVPSLVVHINESGIVTTPINGYTYRTEMYLQQREKQNENKSSLGTKTTWKNLMQQKRIIDNDQAEIDRALSTIDSIHGIFNRSLLIPSNQVYSSLYGDDDKSIRLMKTFCQRQDHYIKEEDKNYTQETSNSFEFFQDSDSDSDNSEEEEEQKKKSYDSGYGSVMPRRHFSRESLVKVSQNLNNNTTNTLL
jgi:hypothetical protein